MKRAGKLAIDESKISVTVAMNLGDTESSSKDAKVKEGIDFDVNTMEEVLYITCHYDKKGTGPIGDSEDISEQRRWLYTFQSAVGNQRSQYRYGNDNYS